jgi:hypothetical protein
MGYDPYSDDFEQKQNEDDGEDEGDAAAAVITEPWSHTVSAEAKHEYQDDQKNEEHFVLRSAKVRLKECDADSDGDGRKKPIRLGCPMGEIIWDMGGL